jgi:hypothetical protein
MDTVVQDDAQFLHRPPAQVRANVQKLVKLGVTRLRLTASWSSLAPSPHSRKVPPAPFDASDSRTYPKGSFTTLDTAIKSASTAGIKPMIDIAFWAPRWAVGEGSPDKRRERYWIDADAFADFATAVARRYSGAFADPYDPRNNLPAVRLFTTWNEPNHPSFLKPQWTKTPDGGYRPESPHIYRAMHNAAYAAIKDVSKSDMVLVGGTAASGSSVPGTGGVPPLAFVRALACVDDKLRPLKVPECVNFHPLKADGFAHHPYSRLTAPDVSDPAPDDVPIADVSRLGDLLGKLYLTGRLAQQLPIYDTEYGYESNQDDPYQPFTRLQQAEFIGWSTYLAWKDPDTQMFAQFLLRDIDPAESGRKRGTRSYYRDWQTGLYTADGAPKPALQAFKLPFWAQTIQIGSETIVQVFGQVRPGHGQRVVQVERQDPATGVWQPIRTYGKSCDASAPQFLTDRAGVFLRGAPFNGVASYRLAWQDEGGTWQWGAPIQVAAKAGEKPPGIVGSPLLLG